MGHFPVLIEIPALPLRTCPTLRRNDGWGRHRSGLCATGRGEGTIKIIEWLEWFKAGSALNLIKHQQ
jgi:hypothetical protein